MSRTDITERDTRVLEALRTELAASDLDLSSTEAVVRKVGELIGSFQDVDVKYVERLRHLWWPVEFNFALSVDQERELTDEEAEQMRQAILALEEIVH
jgi:hypothetical protein